MRMTVFADHVASLYRSTLRCALRYPLVSSRFVGITSVFCCTIALSLGAVPVHAQTLQESLLQRAALGTTCKEIPNNGRYCTYKFGDSPEIGIKDVGGTDTVIGFHHSDIRKELYAVMYFGCVAVVPGQAHPRNYDRDYGVFISPRTGRTYSTSRECRMTL